MFYVMFCLFAAEQYVVKRRISGAHRCTEQWGEFWCQYLCLHTLMHSPFPGACCKSKTGRHNQDQSRRSTNHRRILTRPVLTVATGLGFATCPRCTSVSWFCVLFILRCDWCRTFVWPDPDQVSQEDLILT